MNVIDTDEIQIFEIENEVETPKTSSMLNAIIRYIGIFLILVGSVFLGYYFVVRTNKQKRI